MNTSRGQWMEPGQNIPSPPEDSGTPFGEPYQSLSPSHFRILQIIESVPGATIQLISSRMGCTHSSAAYHLTAMANLNLVIRERDGRKVRHFSASSRQSRGPLRLKALCRDSSRFKVIMFLVSQPLEMMTVNRIAKTIGVAFGLVKRTLMQLEQSDFVVFERHRGRFRIRCNESLIEAFRGIPQPVGPETATVPAPLLTP